MTNAPEKIETWQDRLRAMRRARDLTRAAFAAMCGVAPGTVQDWEDGRIKRLTAKNAITVAEKLDVPLNWLINGVGDPPPIMKTNIQTPKDMADTDNFNGLINLAGQGRRDVVIEALRLLVAASDANLSLMLEGLRCLVSYDDPTIKKGDVTQLLHSYGHSVHENRNDAIKILQNRS